MPATSQPLTADQRALLWVLNREIQMHGAPPVPSLTDAAARANERKRKAREKARGDA